MSLSSLVLYSIVKKNVKKNIESELQTSTSAILNTVKTAVSVSIKNHLRAAAEKNHDIVQHLYDLQAQGKISLNQAKEQAADIILCQKVGNQGYMCILDGNGKVIKHPKKSLEGLDISDHQFVRQMIDQKNGYIEYAWKNPGDSIPRPKALYLNYFKPWDWMIIVSSYRKEFLKLVNIDDFKESILSLRFGKTGYSYVIDTRGNVIIHPELSGANVLTDPRFSNDFFKQMLEKKNGKVVYSWKNPKDNQYRKKMVLFNHIPEYEWIVASSSYLDEVYSPLNTIKNFIILVGLSSLIIFIPITFVLSATITRPLQELRRRFNQDIIDGFSNRLVKMDSQDEVGQLAVYYNSFMDKLDTYSRDLNAQITERKRLEKAIMETGEKERQKIGNDLHDDLCPHLIGIEGLTKVLKRKVEGHSSEAGILSDKITDLIKEAIQKTRRLARGLCPVYFNHGLESSLQELVSNTRIMHRISCHLECRDNIPVKNNMMTINLYHIVQEAVQNAVRHGKADKIQIKMEKQENRFLICVSDNGTGMEPSKESTGMGLRIMKYRAKMMGAALMIHSDRNGTRIRLALPLNVLA